MTTRNRCPKCGKTHYIFKNAAPSSSYKLAYCGQRYGWDNRPIIKD